MLITSLQVIDFISYPFHFSSNSFCACSLIDCLVIKVEQNFTWILSVFFHIHLLPFSLFFSIPKALLHFRISTMMDFLLDSFDTVDLIVVAVIGAIGIYFFFKYRSDSTVQSQHNIVPLQKESATKTDKSYVTRMKNEDRQVSCSCIYF